MSHKDRYCRLTPVSSATFHVKVCGTARRSPRPQPDR